MKKDFVTVTPDSVGPGTEDVTITCDPNFGAARSTSVTFSGEGGCYCTILITQNEALLSITKATVVTNGNDVGFNVYPPIGKPIREEITLQIENRFTGDTNIVRMVLQFSSTPTELINSNNYDIISEISLNYLSITTSVKEFNKNENRLTFTINWEDRPVNYIVLLVDK